MVDMILRLDSKRRLTIPATLAPWKPCDYVDVTYLEDEDALVMRRVERKTDARKVLRKIEAAEAASSRADRKKKKKK